MSSDKPASAPGVLSLLRGARGKGLFSRKAPAHVPGVVRKVRAPEPAPGTPVAGAGAGAGAGSGTAPAPAIELKSKTDADVDRDALSQGRQAARSQRIQGMLDEELVDVDALRELCWGGIPQSLRATAWQLLLGYLPRGRERRKTLIERKRAEYKGNVAHYYDDGARNRTEHDSTILHQIQIDIPRTNPSIPIFQQPEMLKLCERVLYIWAIRHPASGYVQGMNDLLTPFIMVLLQVHVSGPASNCTLADLSSEVLETVEADTYGMFTRLLDGIQSNYTFAQPGIQRMVFRLREVVHRVDEALYNHLRDNSIDFLQFSFRWMNCLLLRELPIHLIVRLWDAYLAEKDSDGFIALHIYVCAALLCRFSDDLRGLEMQDVIVRVQNLPTEGWTDTEIEEILAQAFLWKTLYKDAPSHLETL